LTPLGDSKVRLPYLPVRKLRSDVGKRGNHDTTRPIPENCHQRTQPYALIASKGVGGRQFAPIVGRKPMLLKRIALFAIVAHDGFCS
jgi:hypothetical protein